MNNRVQVLYYDPDFQTGLTANLDRSSRIPRSFQEFERGRRDEEWKISSNDELWIGSK